MSLYILNSQVIRKPLMAVNVLKVKEALVPHIQVNELQVVISFT